MNCRFCGSPPGTDWGYQCGTSQDLPPQRTNRCRQAEVAILKERIKRLESSIIRAANQCFCDGSDGRTAAEMLKILEAAKEAKP